MKKFLKILKRIMLIVLLLIALLAITVVIYMRQPQFGKGPAGERLARIERSPHYKDGRFNNLVYKPTITAGYSLPAEILKIIFKTFPRRAPVDSLPGIKTNLLQLPADSNCLVWFGHSSFLLQIDGKKILVDPSFSGKASPLPWGTRAYKGSNVYSAADMPQIDYLLITHDHYDHLDYETIVALQNKVKHVVCGLGVGGHFEHWGYTPEQLIERDWYEKVSIDSNISIFTESSHHDSGRGFTRGKSLWLSYLIQTPTQKIYISGDGGYDPRFIGIGKKFGPIDWAIMENGQYDKAWQSVHLLPEELRQATLELKAANLLTVHHSKFTLSKHAWDDPLETATELSKGQPYKLATSLIGEVVYLNDTTQQFTQWWKGVK